MKNAVNIIIAAVTPFVVPGNVKKNTDSIIRALNGAKERGANLAVLPRNALTGEIGSMRHFPAMTKAVFSALNKIANNTDIRAVVGFPYGAFDCAAFIDKRRVKGFAVLHDDYEKSGITPFHDSPFKVCDTFEIEDGGRLLICGEEILNDSPRMFDSTDIIAVPAAYPAFMGGFARKKNEACRLSFRNGGCFVAVACAGAGESTRNFVRSGDKIIAGFSQILAASTGDAEEIVIGIRDKGRRQNNNIDAPYTPSYLPAKDGCKEVFDILSRGIYGRMRESNNRRVILGLSGGLDSACVLIAAVKAFDKYNLDRRDIIAVCMPGAPSTSRTRGNADILIERLGVTGMEIPIDSAVRRHLRQIKHNKKDVVYENAQARGRAQILLDLSNKYGALVLGTSDMSESALGFSTYGGDLLAHYNPINSLTKSAIRLLLKDFAEKDAAECTRTALKDELPPDEDKSIEESAGEFAEISEESAEENGIDAENNDAENIEAVTDEQSMDGQAPDENPAFDTSKTLADCVKDILDTPVSPELKKGQETERILGPYKLHEFFLLRLLAYKESAAEIVSGAEAAFTLLRGDIKKYYRIFINRFFKNRFKAAFACDGIQLTPFDLNAFDINWNFDKSMWEI